MTQQNPVVCTSWKNQEHSDTTRVGKSFCQVTPCHDGTSWVFFSSSFAVSLSAPDSWITFQRICSSLGRRPSRQPQSSWSRATWTATPSLVTAATTFPVMKYVLDRDGIVVTATLIFCEFFSCTHKWKTHTGYESSENRRTERR